MVIQVGALIDVADFSDTGWLDDDITWNTDWEDYQPTVTNNHFEYRRVGAVVHLRGLVRRLNSSLSGSTQVMFTLPTGFRPSRSVITAAMTSGTWVTGAASAGTAHTHNVISSTTSGPMLRVTIASTGTVQIIVPAQVSIDNGNWVSMAGISFLVDL